MTTHFQVLASLCNKITPHATPLQGAGLWRPPLQYSNLLWVSLWLSHTHQGDCIFSYKDTLWKVYSLAMLSDGRIILMQAFVHIPLLFIVFLARAYLPGAIFFTIWKYIPKNRNTHVWVLIPLGYAMYHYLWAQASRAGIRIYHQYSQTLFQLPGAWFQWQAFGSQ